VFEKVVVSVILSSVELLDELASGDSVVGEVTVSVTGTVHTIAISATIATSVHD